MSRLFEAQMLDVLGLRGRCITELTIKCAVGKPTEVHLVEILNPSVSANAISRTYELVERKEGAQIETEVGKSVNRPQTSI